MKTSFTPVAPCDDLDPHDTHGHADGRCLGRTATVQRDDEPPAPVTAAQAARLAESLAPWLTEDVAVGQMRVRTYRRTQTRRGIPHTVTAILRDRPAHAPDPRHD